MKPAVIISSGNEAGTEIFYTTDGSDPSERSPKYTVPFVLDKSSIIKAIVLRKTHRPVPPNEMYDISFSSSIVETSVKVYNWMNPIMTSKLQPGISYKYFQPDGNIIMETLSSKPDEMGVANIISLDKKKRKDKFAFEFTGYIKIENDGIYNFYLESDDGSKLLIDNEDVIDNGGYHGTVEKEGKAALKKGYHKIQVMYFDAGGGNSLKLSIQSDAGDKKEVSASMLYH